MACCQALEQFTLVTWKNVILIKRNLLSFTFLMSFVIIFPLILFFLNWNFGKLSEIKPSTEPTFALTNKLQLPSKYNARVVLAFSPNVQLVRRIVEKSADLMDKDSIEVLACDNESELERVLRNVSVNALCGIVFLNSSLAGDKLSSNISYKIRPIEKEDGGWFTSVAMPTDLGRIGTRQNFAQKGGSVPGYFTKGFLTIQKAIDSSIIGELKGEVSLMKTYLKKMAFPGNRFNTFSSIIYNTLALFTMVGFCSVSSAICKEVVDEKERKVKEYMKLLGLKNWINWSAWFCKYASMTGICAAFITAVYHVKAGESAVLAHTSPTVTFAFVYLYSLATVMLSFAITTPFNKGRTATFCAVIIYIFSVFLDLFSINQNDFFKQFQVFFLCLFPNLNFGLGCRIIVNFENLGSGIHWYSVNRGCENEDGFSLLNVFGVFLLNILIYGVITWYVDVVHPGEFGTPQPLCFPFTRHYWFGSQPTPRTDNFNSSSLKCDISSDYFEPNNSGNKIAIQTRNLTKIFNKGLKPAVNDLNMDICEGSIVAMLGQNGAGKTTTMSMLTGFIPPSDGAAFINGLSITRDMNIIRQNLGFCPQGNILFDTMTVEEHLYFFARLKGVDKRIVGKQVTGMIDSMTLSNNKKTISKKLSGGIKRKLSVAIALIGGSKLVILDEPTSGLDPEARREIWDILKSNRHGRTMILSTHYMDEADHLGDKIAIMADGVLRCFGSSMFLKKKYGIGYHLTIVKTPTCDETKIEDVIKKVVSEARLTSVTSAELTYHLPKESSSNFSWLFSSLEANKSDLGVETFGVSVTSLEEVFIKVGELCRFEGEEKRTNEDDAFFNDTSGSSKSFGFQSTDAIVCKDLSKGVRIKGLSLTVSRFLAMFQKRFLFSFRGKVFSSVQILLPAAFAMIACAISGFSAKRASPPLLLNLEMYDEPVTVYATVKIPYWHPSNLTDCYKRALDATSSGSAMYLNDRNYSYRAANDMDRYFMNMSNENLHKYRKSYQVAAEIGIDYIIGFYNDESYHNLAVTLNVVDNAWLRCLVPQYSPNSYFISTINHPIGKLSNETKYDHNSELKLPFSLFVYYGLLTLTATFSVFLINERRSGLKIGQYISGATPLTFWLATFAWDFLNYLLPCFLIVVVILAFRVEGYSSGSMPGFIFLGLLVHGWSSIPLVYLLSFLFSKGTSGFTWILTFCMLTGIGSTYVLVLLQDLLSVPAISIPLEWLFYALLPSFCMLKYFQSLLVNFSINKFCTMMASIEDDLCSSTEYIRNKCCSDACVQDCFQSNYLSWQSPGSGKSLTFMGLQGLVFFAFLFLIESDAMNSIRRNFSTRLVRSLADGVVATLDGDEDVREERDSVLNLEQEELSSGKHSLVLKKLTKGYAPRVLAVNNLCLKVHPGEIFGLLGVNGAGKTSTFKVLTGEETITSGEVYIKGINVARDLTKTRQYIGYCPQFDSLIDELTVQEHLVLHAGLWGIPRRWLKAYVTRLARSVALSRCTKSKVKTLSGGNKRKLCFAIALIGRPTLILLDEPTTGIDPVARRELWNLLTLVRQTGSTVFLTSHSMEECEALCTRLAIMVNGQFKCLGNTQCLKSKYGSGYSVALKVAQDQDQMLNASSLVNVKDFVSTHFPGSKLEFEKDGLLNYRVEKSTPGATLANIFGLLESSREILQLDDYSVGQATLEQIFINFAVNQQLACQKFESDLCYNAAYNEVFF